MWLKSLWERERGFNANNFEPWFAKIKRKFFWTKPTKHAHRFFVLILIYTSAKTTQKLI